MTKALSRPITASSAAIDAIRIAARDRRRESDIMIEWKKVSDEKPSPNSPVICWDGHNYHMAFYAEFGKPGCKPGEGEYVFNGCHWATHWAYLAPPS